MLDRVPGLLKHVSASGNGYISGVNKNDQIYKCKKPCSGRWYNVGGHLMQIDGGQGYVYGVNKNNDIFRLSVDDSGGWRHIPSKLKHVTVSGSCLYKYLQFINRGFFNCNVSTKHD